MSEQASPPRRPAIPRTIWALGFVSLFTDMGSEMVHSLLPVLLAGTLGASALTIGLIEGSAEALVLVTKVFGKMVPETFFACGCGNPRRLNSRQRPSRAWSACPGRGRSR